MAVISNNAKGDEVKPGASEEAGSRGAELTRADLDTRAAELGLSGPFANKQEVKDAIDAAEQAQA